MKNGTHRRRRRSILPVICIILALLLAAAAAGWFFVVENIAEGITVEAGIQTVDATAFRIRDFDIPVKFISDLSGIDLNKPGSYPVRLSYCYREYDAVLYVKDTVSPAAGTVNVTALSIHTPEPEEFVTDIEDISAVTVEYETQPDMTAAGDQTVALLLTDESGNTARVEATLTVIVDTQPPVIGGVADMTVYQGQEVNYLSGIVAADDLDEEPVLEVDTSGLNTEQAGEYEIIYTATDASGNVATATAMVTLIVDNEAPVILGINPISLYLGGTVAYRSGVIVRDDQDPAPVLTVDNGAVDLSKVGVYEVVYKAVDAAGNETLFPTTVTVEPKPETYVDEQIIFEEADKLLATIVTDDMTNEEKAEKIYKWLLNRCVFVNSSDKTDWLQAAYIMMDKRSGDCFNYFALAKLFFDRLGFPNMMVQRLDNPHRDTQHFWNLVSIDGGETYYHFDATPRPSVRNGKKNFCLVTDAYLAAYDDWCPGYYFREYELYPATPAK